MANLVWALWEWLKASDEIQAALLATALAVLLTWLHSEVSRWGRVRRSLTELEIEIDVAENRAQLYIGDEVAAPLYRAPDVLSTVARPSCGSTSE